MRGPEYRRGPEREGGQGRRSGKSEPLVADGVDCNAIATYSIFGCKRGRQMASITIRNLDDGIKRRLRVRAAEHGRSMEEEAREILREVVGDQRPPLNLARSLRARAAKTGGVELDIPARDAMREPPTFGQ